MIVCVLYLDLGHIIIKQRAPMGLLDLLVVVGALGRAGPGAHRSAAEDAARARARRKADAARPSHGSLLPTIEFFYWFLSSLRIISYANYVISGMQSRFKDFVLRS